jgi:excinuclease ABC subunit A
VIDLGPEGGVKGGEIVAEGVPEDVARAERSFTGRYLAPLLGMREKGAAGVDAEEERVAAE